MRGITRIAKQSAGRSRQCAICPLRRSCTPAIHRACFDAYVEGFKKGAKLIEQLNKQKQ